MRKTIFLVILAVLALAPIAQAQQPRGYYDQYGRYHEYDQNDGYYDSNGQWHANDTRTDGYYDRNGQWHANDTRTDGYYDRNGQWHPRDARSGGYFDRDGRWHADDRYYGRVAGPDRWTFSERGRSETLPTATANFAQTTSSVVREARRRSRYDDPAALETLQRLAEQAQYLARVTQGRNRPDLVGEAYNNVVATFVDAQQRFGALEPDGWLDNQFHVLAAAMGRLDKRYFGNRAFGGQNPGNTGYGNNRSGYDYRYDRYGNTLPVRPGVPRPY
jgi:hypothetical protein